MIKSLSYTEVQKFHKNLAKKMLDELRNSESENNSTPVENIEWAYSFETDDEDLDIRKRRVSIDKGIRREKLLKLDSNLRKKKEKSSIFSIFSREKEPTDTISEELKDFFSKIVVISLMIKVGDYERFERVEKTSLFESKLKEEFGKFQF